MTRIDFADFDRIILGIDPGTNIMGYGVLGIQGKKLTLISIGVIMLDKLENHALKLKSILERNLALIDQYHPDEVALEAPFYGKNIQSMLKLGRAQGVAMAAALHRGVPIFEYAPRRVKQSITGSGNASKEQVAGMIKTLLSLDSLPSDFDATDAMGVAICHYFSGGATEGLGKIGKKGKAYNGWKAFVKENPEKLKK
jgi:crossover junction endodeoxyribonuclease RuvC